MALPENYAPMRGGERSWWRSLLELLLLTGLAFLIWQNRSQARQLADLESSLRELDSRVELSAERMRAVPALRPSLTINPVLADEIAERVIARMSVPAKPAEPKRPAGGEKGIAPVSPSEDRANTIVDAAIRSGKLRQEDVLAIREILAKSGDPEAFRRVGTRIAAAINRDEIQPESPEVMFP